MWVTPAFCLDFDDKICAFRARLDKRRDPNGSSTGCYFEKFGCKLTENVIPVNKHIRFGYFSSCEDARVAIRRAAP